MTALKRWIALSFAVVASSRVASASAVIEAADVSFGLVDNGASLVRYINVANTGPTTLSITGATFGGNDAGWFSFAGDGCSGTTSCVLSLSVSSTAVVVPVRCAPPAGSMGTQIATVTFASNSTGVANPTSTLTCTAGGGMVDLTPASGTLEFGAVDLDRVPTDVVELIRIHNMGDAPMTIGSGVPSGSDLARFSFSTSIAGASLLPDAELDVLVTYTPIAERTALSPDVASIAFPVLGAVGTTLITVALEGHGVERHAGLVSVPTFPDTFRNPGTAGPILPVTISNSGEAVLGLTGTTITGAPAWSVVDPNPEEVPGFADFDVLVQFTPTVAGPAPTATLTIGTTDHQNPTITVMLSGNGLDRDVVMGPASIDLGFAGIGQTASISDGTRGLPISVTNHDPANTFVIRSIDIEGGEAAFAIPDAAGFVLAPLATQTFDVEITPPHAGLFQAVAHLYLDQDTTPQTTISLQGQGVFVDAGGGGGCSTTRDAGGGGLVLVLVALLVLRRKRLAIVGCALVAATAHADTRNLQLGVFDPIPSTTNRTFQVQDATVGHDGDWVVSALVSYANDPLVLDTTQNQNISIQNRETLVLGGAYAFGDRFEAGLRIPLYFQSGENLNSLSMFGEPAASGSAVGDLTVHAKGRAWSHHGPEGELVTGGGLALSLPTATDQQFAGSSKPTLRIVGLATYTPREHLFITANAGAVIRARAQFHDIDQGSGFVWGVSGGVIVRDDVTIDAELFGELDPGGLHDAPTGSAAMGPAHVLDTIEALAGVHVQLARNFNLAVAAGRGVTSEIGSPAWRGIVALTFAPAAESIVGVKRVSGDSDHDGVPDDVDRCPNEPEDRDGWQDEDGCPDPDNDNDGIPDTKDKCPNDPEDRDGFEDENGCPDPDNDRDGIPDTFDHCPNEPETINGVEDEDGCPDSGPPGLVTIAHDHFDVAEPIVFTASGKIAPESFNVLGQLGATLRAHIEYLKLKIVTRVTEAHAATIVDWLVQYGVARDRLVAGSAIDKAARDERVDVIVIDRY